MRRPTAALPNGCGAGWSAGPVPDALADVDFSGCCDLHDLAYYEGGFGGLFTRKPRSDWALGRCLARRFRARAEALVAEAAVLAGGGGTKAYAAFDRARALRRRAYYLRALGEAAGLGYTLAVLLVGWTPLTWPWRRRALPSAEELADLAEKLRP